MEYYTTSVQHILAELERGDLLVQAQVQQARQVQEADDEFQGLYISDKEGDVLPFETKLAARQRFAPSAPLLKHHLLHLFNDPSHYQPPLLSTYLKVDERVANYLLDSDELDARLLPYARHTVPQTPLEDLLLPEDFKRCLARLALGKGANDEGLIFHFEGPYGVGKQTTAEALCREFGARAVSH